MLNGITNAAVIGAGTIGQSWVAAFLASGLNVTASDPDPAADKRLRDGVATVWPDLVALGLTTDRIEQGLARLRFDTDPAVAVNGAHVVQECAPEDLSVKQALLAAIEPALAPDALILSSTSGIRPSDMQAEMSHPERLAVGHPCNPPHLVPLVEVVGGAATSDDTITRAMAFYEGIGKQPIRLNKEMPGHVVNRLQSALWREAVNLANEGVASVADIDRAVTQALGVRWCFMGPNMVFHLAGGADGMEGFIDRLGPAFETWWDDLGTPRLDAATARTLIDGMAEAAEGRSPAELAKARDAALMRVLALNRQM